MNTHGLHDSGGSAPSDRRDYPLAVLEGGVERAVKSDKILTGMHCFKSTPDRFAQPRIKAEYTYCYECKAQLHNWLFLRRITQNSRFSYNVFVFVYIFIPLWFHRI